MSFGLTNAPSTFQSLMNQVFKPFFHKFILFFYDIPIYIKNEGEHVKHLEMTLEVLRYQQLYAKLSKCKFGSSEVAYLGHIVLAQRVKADSNKLKVMWDWPKSQSVKALREFLGLTRYYRQFIKGYGDIAGPLTQLLKKGGFQ